MATLNIDIQSQNRARRQLLETRQQIQDINVQLTKNAAEYLKADDAQKAKLRTDRAELTLSRRRLSNSAAQVRIYQAETREIERLAREKQKLNRVGQLVSRTFADLRFHIAGAFTNEILYGIGNFASEIIRIGSETETARATLRQFTDDVDGTFQRLERESQALVNIDLTDIIFSFTQLRGAGADAEESITLVRGFSKSLAELGVSSAETTRFMTQLRQSFSADAIEGDDIKTLIEVMPTFLQRASQSLGVNVESWKNLQDAIDESGKTVRQFYVDLARQQDIQSAGADIDTFRAQTQLLREEWQGFQRDLAQHVIPALTDLIKIVRTGGVALGIFDAPVADTSELATTRTQLAEVNAQLQDVATNLNIVDTDDALATINAQIARLQDREGWEFFFSRFQSLSGVIQDQRDLYDATNALFEERERLQTRINELVNQEAAAQERVNQAVAQRPTPTGDFGLTQPFDTFSPQDRVGPLGFTQPDQTFGGLEQRETFLRPLQEVGPQINRSDIQEIQTSVKDTAIEVLRNTIREVTPSRLDTSGFTPSESRLDIRPTIETPIAPPVADLSGGLDLGQILPSPRTGRTPIQEDIDTFIRGQRLPAQPSDIAAFIPVDQFEQALSDIETNFQEEQRLQREILQGRRAFARDAERDIASRERVSGALLQTGVESALGLANIPQDLLGISQGGADQRRAAAERSAEELESIERSAQRRIEEIQNSRELSERERADRILQINQDLAERRADIEASYAARITEIEAQTAQQRSNYYFQFAESAINDINRVIQRELVLRLIRDLSAALPGGIGTGILAVASLGLTAATTGLAAAQSNRSESLAREQQRRFEGAARGSNNFELTIRNDDGTLRKQQTETTRVVNEGRTPR